MDDGQKPGGAEAATEEEKKVETEPREHVTLAEDEAEPEAEEETEAEAEDESGEETEPKRPSRTRQRSEKIRRLAEENARLRAALDGGDRSPAGKDDDLKEPKESDFPNDYLAYERALRKYETRLAVREENQQREQASEQSRENARLAARQAAYNVRLEDIKDRIPDFDKVLKSASGVEIRDDVRDLVLESDKGPLLAYYLAKNVDVIDELNRMTPLAAAREIGRLESRIRGPQAKKATNAPAPVRTPKGGTEPTTRSPDVSKMDNETYRRLRAEGKI